MGLNVPMKAIVFTDEMWIEFNSSRRQGNVSRPQGANLWEYAIHEDFNHTTIRIMFWGCIAFGKKGPCYIWETKKEQEKDTERHIAIMEDENRKRQKNGKNGSMIRSNKHESLEQKKPKFYLTSMLILIVSIPRKDEQEIENKDTTKQNMSKDLRNGH